MIVGIQLVLLWLEFIWVIVIFLRLNCGALLLLGLCPGNVPDYSHNLVNNNYRINLNCLSKCLSKLPKLRR